jgi:circadian clock protein KaiC
MSSAPRTRPVPITKCATGIAGFDAITGGGLPCGRISVVIGGPGTGKTVFAMQTLAHAVAEAGETAVFVAFEESAADIRANMAGFDWDWAALDEERLYLLDARLEDALETSGQFDLGGTLRILDDLIERMDARWLVLDGIDMLLTRLGDPATERRELLRLHAWLKRRGVTTLITAKSDPQSPQTPTPYGFLAYLADCVVALHHRLQDLYSVRGLRVVKYRGSGFAGNEFPMVMSAHGLEVAYQDRRQLTVKLSGERIGTGIHRLDYMLGGGYFRGSSIIVSGKPGTAKTTLAGAFAACACEHGERVLFISFDESAEQIERNLRSVNIDLASCRERGLLHAVGLRSKAFSVEEHFLHLRALIDRHTPDHMVVDPVSALSNAGAPLQAVDVAQRLLDHAKQRGITLLCTAISASGEPLDVEAASGVSTLADTWLHLSFNRESGERGRGLTIIKSRGTKHSHEIRELLLSDAGVELADVFVAGDELLMGSARWRREREVQAEASRLRTELEQRLRQARGEEAQLRARIDMLRAELDSQRAQHALEHDALRQRLRRLDEDKMSLLALRGADDEMLALLGQLQEPAFAHDAEQRLVRVNDAYLEAAGEQEATAVLGRPYHQVYPRTDEPACRLEHGLDTTAVHEHELTTLDGQRLRVRHYVISDTHGGLRYGILVIHPMVEEMP